jgi:malonyl-CoA O-methyltransferase
MGIENQVNYDHTIDKRQMRNAFGRAAPHYDQAAVLQREICHRMLARLEYIKYKPDVILDAGSGTGYGTRELLMRYPSARLLAIDIAPAMHLQARPAIPWWRQLLKSVGDKRGHQASYIVGDIEQIPLADSCTGLVWTN